MKEKNVGSNDRIQCHRIRCSSYAGPRGDTATPPDVKKKPLQLKRSIFSWDKVIIGLGINANQFY